MTPAHLVIAEADGTAWLVAGEAWLDELLDNRLPEEALVEVVPCADHAAAMALWRELAGGEVVGQPWAIHPNILRRVRQGTGRLGVVFAPWSAALDPAALAAVRDAAALALARPAVTIRLIGQADAGGAAAALLGLRQQLLEDALVGAGVERARLDRAVRTAADAGWRAELAETVELALLDPG